MKRTILIVAALALLLYGACPVNAVPITYVEETIGTGTLGSSSFTNSLVTLTLVGDTTNVSPFPPAISGPGFSNLGAATVYVANLNAMAIFTDTMWAVVNHGARGAGISDVTENLLVLGTRNPVFASYGLATAIGPISGASIYNSTLGIFPTTLGNLVLTNAENSTFTATVDAVPELASMLLLGSGLIGIWGTRRKYKK
jgi:hypothetical protein